MANESTTTTWSSQTLSEALAPVAIPAHLPKMVVGPHANQDTIEGEPTLKKQYPVESDIGAASSGTEGTDLTTNTELSMSSAITVTPTEGALIKAEITTRAARRRFPGLAGRQLYEALRGADLSTVVQVLAPDARRLAMACFEKAESDVCDLLGGFSNSVGTSGSDVTVSDLINAIYTLKTLEPHHENWGFFLTPNQVKEIQLEVGATGGGLGGSVWFQQGDLSFFNQRPDASRNGFRGSFMGIPVYEYAHSLRTTVNSGDDVAGALMCLGQGAPGMDADPNDVGALAFCEGEEFRFDIDYDASKRAVELIAVYEYAATELDDSNGTGIHTDAP